MKTSTCSLRCDSDQYLSDQFRHFNGQYDYTILLAIFQVWSLQNCKLKTDHIGHHGYLNTVTMSPDGSLCASGGKDAKAMLWDLNDGKHLYTLDNNDIINSLCFRYVRN